ncbi:transposase [Lactococcus cremoris]|uniref:Transposase n=1 Tax=Lactococcus lactis subsp. cremoris TaxID=1359 RepID=A0A166IU54_LACLC|nr:transposase [Lactococcus cremoris]
MDMVFTFGLAEFDKAGNFVLKVINEADYNKISLNLEAFGKLMNPIQINIHGVKIGISSKDSYSTLMYGRSIFRKWEKSPEKFAGRTVFSKAQIEDFKIFGKSILKNESKAGKIISKFPSFNHGQVNADLRMMRENRSNFSAMTKVGKGFRIAGWIGTAVDAGTSAADYKSKGYSNEQVVELTARKTAVDVATSTAGSTVGRVAGAALGQALIPIPGVGAAVGAVAGGIVGGIVGGWIGGVINDHFDKGVKPKKKGLSWPW